jgi:hypothetical protein
MGRRSNVGVLAFVIVIALIILAIVNIVIAIVNFIANNILTISFGALSILAIVILVSQIKKGTQIIRSKIKKPQIPVMKISKKTIHPFYYIVLHLININGIDVLQNVQKCRGLLKDYAKNEYKSEVLIFSELLIQKVPDKIIKLSGSNYHAKLTTDICKKYLHASKQIEDYKIIISMLLEFLSDHNLLNIRIRDDSERPIIKIKTLVKETTPFIKYYACILFNGIKNNYKLVLPSFFLISSLVLFFLSIRNNRETLENTSYSTPPKNNIQMEVEPEKEFAYISATALNMRARPSATSSIIMQLHQNDKIQILLHEGEWSNIVFGDYRGYVNSSYLSSSIIPVQVQQPARTRTPPKLNLADKGVKQKE